MAGASNIEWTDATWNPVTGCARVSAGCDHCYAVAMTHRLEGMGAGRETRNGGTLTGKYAGLTVVNGKGDRHFNGTVRCHEDVLEWPLHKKKPLKIFVNSMSDLFHWDVPFEFIDKVFAVMALCPQHTFQILTKRPERMAEYLRTYDQATKDTRHLVVGRAVHRRKYPDAILAPQLAALNEGVPWPLPNVWLGTSIENQETAHDRIPHLLACPSAVRFLSVEPMLGLVDLRAVAWPSKVGWVIVGGESGPGARPMHPDWVRGIRDHCVSAGVPFFFKQWGEWKPIDQPQKQDNPRQLNRSNERWLNWAGGSGYHGVEVWRMRRGGKKVTSAKLDGVEHREFPRAKAEVAA